MWYGLDEVPQQVAGCVVTIGVFDGVHRGHRTLIGDAVARARDNGVPAVCLTFAPHPLAVIAPDRMPPLLAPVSVRSALVERLGVDHMLALNFTHDFAAMSPAEFFSHVIVDTLEASAVYVGANFTFGHRAAGTTATLRELGQAYGVDVVVHDLLADDCGETVSSSAVRKHLGQGDVARARPGEHARELRREAGLCGVASAGTATTTPLPHLRTQLRLLIGPGSGLPHPRAPAVSVRSWEYISGLTAPHGGWSAGADVSCFTLSP